MSFFRRAWQAVASTAHSIWQKAIVPAARWTWDRVIQPALEIAAPIAVELLSAALIDILRRNLGPKDDGFAPAPN